MLAVLLFKLPHSEEEQNEWGSAWSPSLAVVSKLYAMGKVSKRASRRMSEGGLYQLVFQLCPPDLTSELPGPGAAELTGLPDTDGSATHKDSDPPQPGPGGFTHTSRLPTRCFPSPSLR